jgi:hypothetical protein
MKYRNKINDRDSSRVLRLRVLSQIGAYPWLTIGHAQRIFLLSDVLLVRVRVFMCENVFVDGNSGEVNIADLPLGSPLVTRREYFSCLTSYWSHTENIPLV